MTIEERTELRSYHQPYAHHQCWSCWHQWPCPVIRLLDALDDADRKNAAVTARLEEFAAKLGRRLD